MTVNSQSNLNDLTAHLQVPTVLSEAPSAGKRVKAVTTGWHSAKAYHTLYLPEDWSHDRLWPVIAEYPGNGNYSNQLGDTSDGSVEGCMMGYGLSNGHGFIWIALPFVNATGSHTIKWWGDVEKTKAYCKDTIAEVCKLYAGDPERVILTGFSRGAIACNYIGLHDDGMATLWCGMISHSHHEATFRHPGSSDDLWQTRLKRLRYRPLFISHERTIDPIRNALQNTGEKLNVTYGVLPYKNHSQKWTLCDIELKHHARKWLLQFSNETNAER